MSPSLTRISTRGSSHSGSDRKSKTSFFGAIKNIFSHSDSGYSNGAGTANVRSKSQRQRRLSVLSVGSNDKRSSLKELEERRSYCLAIRTARNEPIEVQNLLVDCEFCNPPPQYGEPYTIDTPGWHASDVLTINRENFEGVDEGIWNQGLQEWLKTRDEWLRKTAKAVPSHHSLQGVSPDKYFVIYDKFVRHTRPLKEPMNLDDAVQLIKAGWVGEGTWPSQISPEDRWSDDEEEPHDASQLSIVLSDHKAASEESCDEALQNNTKVQFGLLPTPSGQSDRPSLKRIERTQSSMSNLTLARTHSNSSSLVSVTTDEDGK